MHAGQWRGGNLTSGSRSSLATSIALVTKFLNVVAALPGVSDNRHPTLAVAHGLLDLNRDSHQRLLSLGSTTGPVARLSRKLSAMPVRMLYYVLMRTTLRKAREASGVSMKELARRLGVTVPSVSSLELNDERGSAKPQTVDRALEALGLARWDVILPAEVLNGIVRAARASVGRVRWTMALEAQNISDNAVEELVSRSVARRVAARR
jgi:transcriptional regulator with XRE-family HTH domain